METFDPSKVIASRPWIDKAIEAVAPSWGKQRLQSRVETALFSYNAAQTNRLYAPKTYGQPSESTQTSRSRVVMMWESRDLVENFPEAREITRKFGNYLTPNEYSPATQDRAYNQIVSEFFHEWCKRCDVTGRHTFKKLIQLGCEERPVDGDCGYAIRRVGDELKIQLVPGTRIGNPNALGAESDNYYQGIITDEFGKPVAYRIYRVTREGVYFGAEDVAAHNFCHYFDPFRVDQYRGITDFHAAIKTARMLYEILEAEKAGVRFASQQAALVFNDRGSANPRNLFTPQPTVTMPNGQTQQNEMSEVGMIRYLGAADRVEVMPSRPSAAFSGFVQHLMHEIAIGVGVPEGVLFGTQDYKGPSVRAEFAAADRVFTRHQGVLTDKVLDPIKDAVILDAIARGEMMVWYQPIFSTRKVKTSVTVWDGQTVALGGLIREDVQDVEDKLPVLGDLPFIGRLFRSEVEDHFKRNLMIFVTATLIDPAGQRIKGGAVDEAAPGALGGNPLLPAIGN